MRRAESVKKKDKRAGDKSHVLEFKNGNYIALIFFVEHAFLSGRPSGQSSPQSFMAKAVPQET
jgi:hypothetical protein